AREAARARRDEGDAHDRDDGRDPEPASQPLQPDDARDHADENRGRAEEERHRRRRRLVDRVDEAELIDVDGECRDRDVAESRRAIRNEPSRAYVKAQKSAVAAAYRMVA